MAVLSPDAGPAALLLAAERDISAAWLRRFTGADGTAPAVARDLFHRVLVALAAGGDAGPDLVDAAQALGVLRAQQGHGTSTVTEDLLALRPYLWGRLSSLAEASDDLGELLLVHERLVHVVDEALRAVIEAYVEETARMLGARASRDPLTGLLNRGGFDEALGQEIRAAARTTPPALLLVDLDGFKTVNDTAGHLAGDRILVGVAGVLEAGARGSDVVARIGGDEFAVLLPRTDARRAAAVAQRLLDRARRDDRLQWSGGRVGLSVGVGWLADPGAPEALVAAADEAMYRAKRAGGDRVDTGGVTT